MANRSDQAMRDRVKYGAVLGHAEPPTVPPRPKRAAPKRRVKIAQAKKAS